MGPGVRIDETRVEAAANARTRGEPSIMAVTRAEKETELSELAGVFKGADAAILLDYKGINVPQVTELRRELRKAKAGYRVVKNTLARRALKGTTFETLDRPLPGHGRGRVHRERSGGAGQDADRLHEGRADAADQGGGGAGPGDQAGRGRPTSRTCRANPSSTRGCCP